ncbi:MAG: transcription termination/antitermination protein NusG [Candidatus Babeliales bacterium]
MKRWYVLQVYAGYEESVKADLARRAKEEGFQENIGEVLVPSARLKHFFDAQEAQDEQLFPGYVLIEMEVVPGVVRMVTSNPRVLRFLGGNKEPIPLTNKEIERILSQMRGEVAVSAEKKSEFTIGTEVEIKEGPFAGFVGIVEKIEDENERLTVMVSIFGRMTPVELSFNQIKH